MGKKGKKGKSRAGRSRSRSFKKKNSQESEGTPNGSTMVETSTPISPASVVLGSEDINVVNNKPMPPTPLTQDVAPTKTGNELGSYQATKQAVVNNEPEVSTAEPADEPAKPEPSTEVVVSAPVTMEPTSESVSDSVVAEDVEEVVAPEPASEPTMVLANEVVDSGNNEDGPTNEFPVANASATEIEKDLADTKTGTDEPPVTEQTSTGVPDPVVAEDVEVVAPEPAFECTTDSVIEPTMELANEVADSENHENGPTNESPVADAAAAELEENLSDMKTGMEEPPATDPDVEEVVAPEPALECITESVLESTMELANEVADSENKENGPINDESPVAGAAAAELEEDLSDMKTGMEEPPATEQTSNGFLSEAEADEEKVTVASNVANDHAIEESTVPEETIMEVSKPEKAEDPEEQSEPETQVERNNNDSSSEVADIPPEVVPEIKNDSSMPAPVLAIQPDIEDRADDTQPPLQAAGTVPESAEAVKEEPATTGKEPAVILDKIPAIVAFHKDLAMNAPMTSEANESQEKCDCSACIIL